MKKIEAYKSESGVIYENIDDAIRADDAPPRKESLMQRDKIYTWNAATQRLAEWTPPPGMRTKLLSEKELEAIYNNGK